MARKLSTGITGNTLLGTLAVVTDNTITSIGTNQNLIIDPNGSGQTNVVGTLQIQNANSLKLADSDNSNTISIKSPGSLAADYTLTMPADDGTSNQILQTDGSGNLSWVDKTINVSDDTTTNSTFYPLFTSSTSGTITAATVSSSKLRFNPSAGTMTVGIVTGSTSASANLVLRSTTNGSKGQVYIDEGTASSSTSTGALRVAGGVGIAGSVFIGGTMSAATISETSSITLKENINPIQNALDSIAQLAGVIYDRKDGSSKDEAGLIAEDVNQVLPNLVTKDENGNPQSIMYTKLSAYLIEAVKELKDEIYKLKRT